MAVFLTVLKIIGIVLLCILGLLLLLILLLLFWPFFYSLEAAKTEEITAKGRVTWLLHLIVVEVIWQNGLNKRLKIFGIPVYDQKRKEAKAAAKAEKEKKKAEAKAAKEDKKKEETGTDIKEEVPIDQNEEPKPAEQEIAEETAEVSETSSADSEPSSDEDEAAKEKTPEESNKKKKKKSFDDFLDWLEKKWDQFMDFLDRAPDKLADWLDFLPDKAEELIETVEYYDRLLNSEGTEWVINYVKDHGGKLLFHVLPYRTDGTLDYCDEDPGNVAKIYE